MPPSRGCSPGHISLFVPSLGASAPTLCLLFSSMWARKDTQTAHLAAGRGQQHEPPSYGNCQPQSLLPASRWCSGVAEDAQECGRDRDQHRLAAATGSWVLSATLDLPPLGNPCGQISTTDCERENHLQSRLEVQRGGKTTFIITVITIINTTFLPQPHAKQSPALPLSPYPTRQEERVTLQTIATQPPKPTQLLPFDHKSRQINICS